MAGVPHNKARADPRPNGFPCGSVFTTRERRSRQLITLESKAGGMEGGCGSLRQSTRMRLRDLSPICWRRQRGDGADADDARVAEGRAHDRCSAPGPRRDRDPDPPRLRSLRSRSDRRRVAGGRGQRGNTVVAEPPVHGQRNHASQSTALDLRRSPAAFRVRAARTPSSTAAARPEPRRAVPAPGP